MTGYKVIAITHKNFTLEEIGLFHIEEERQQAKLADLKQACQIHELIYLTTCNRVEFKIFNCSSLTEEYKLNFFRKINNNFTEEQVIDFANKAEYQEGMKAVKHMFNVASSLDSMIVGEREIITQVKGAYDNAVKHELAGDMLRIAQRKTIETAKQVYTETGIAKNPVSVVSLAWRELKSHNIKADSKIVFIGSGQTNTNMAKFLFKHGCTNFIIYNRSIENAEKLAKEINGTARTLDQLKDHTEGADVIIACTSSTEPIVTKEIYDTLIGDDNNQKVVVDLAIPNEIDEAVIAAFNIHYISMQFLQKIASENIALRKQELNKCEDIIQQNLEEFDEIYNIRQVERAMNCVPKKIKEIKQTAIQEVFAKDIASLDEQSKGVLEKVMSYMEKKCISVPMKMAKEIILDNKSNNE